VPIGNTRLCVLRRNDNIALVVVFLGRLLVAGHCVSQQSPGEHHSLPTLTTAHQAHSLTIEHSAQGYPVQLLAVVTYYDPYIDPKHPTVWVTDSSGGIYIELSSMPQVPFSNRRSAGDYRHKRDRGICVHRPLQPGSLGRKGPVASEPSHDHHG
jgi:hypothetical protein